MHVSKCMSDTVYVRYIRVCEWMYNHVNLSLSLFEYVHVSVYLCVCAQSSVLSDYLWLHVAYRAPPIHGIFPSKNTEVGCYFLLQGIFLTQGSNQCLLHLLHWQVGPLPLQHQGTTDCLWIEINLWACSFEWMCNLWRYVSISLCKSELSLFIYQCVNVFFCVHTYEWICKHVHAGSMFTCEWMYNHVHLCQILNVYICFWVIAWVYVYVWMLIISMYVTVNECTCEFVTRFTVCALVHLCVQITVWVYTSDHVSVFEWKCKHVMYVHDYEWMYALYFCFSRFFLELMCKQVCQ